MPTIKAIILLADSSERVNNMKRSREGSQCVHTSVVQTDHVMVLHHAIA